MTIDNERGSDSIERVHHIDTVDAIRIEAMRVVDTPPCIHEDVLRAILQHLKKLSIDQSRSDHSDQSRHDQSDQSDQSEHVDPELRKRTGIGIRSTAELLIEYKTASGVRTNQIEFILIDNNNASFADCSLNNTDLNMMIRIEKSIETPESLQINTSEILRFMDMVSRVCLTQIIDQNYDCIEGYRNNVKNVFRRGILMRMRNIRGCMTIHDAHTSNSSERDEIMNLIKRAVVELYLAFDVFCVLSTLHPDIDEFRYFLHRDSKIRNHPIIKTGGDLNRLSDIIYYHNLDSNMIIETKKKTGNVIKEPIKKTCRCRFDAFMPRNSLVMRYRKGEISGMFVFDLLSKELQKKEATDIDQIELIKKVMETQKDSKSDALYLRSLLQRSNNKRKQAQKGALAQKNALPKTIPGKKFVPYEYDNRKDFRKHQRNHTGHNYNIRKQKSKSAGHADQNRSWRNKQA